MIGRRAIHLLLLATLGPAAGCSGPAVQLPAPDPGPRALAPTTRAPDLPKGVATRLAQELLAASDVVVVGDTRGVRSAGRTLLLIELEAREVLRGDLAVGETFLVVTYSVDSAAGERELLYLSRLQGEARFELDYRVESQDEYFEQKLQATRHTLALARLRDPYRRAAATIDWLAAAVGSDDPWFPRYALDELRYLAHRYPGVFDERALEAVRAAAAICPSPSIAADVENVASRIETRLQDGPRPRDKAPFPP